MRYDSHIIANHSVILLWSLIIFVYHASSRNSMCDKIVIAWLLRTLRVIKGIRFFFTKEFFSYMRWKILAFYLFKLTNRKTEITINFSRENSHLRCNILRNKFSLAVGISPLLLSRVAFGRLSTVQICIYSNACAIGYTHTLGKNFECRFFPPSTSLAATKPPCCPLFRLFQTFDRYLLLKRHFAVFCIFLNVRTFRYYFSELQSFILR